jgi:hypothetical protein
VITLASVTHLEKQKALEFIIPGLFHLLKEFKSRHLHPCLCGKSIPQQNLVSELSALCNLLIPPSLST